MYISFTICRLLSYHALRTIVDFPQKIGEKGHDFKLWRSKALIIRLRLFFFLLYSIPYSSMTGVFGNISSVIDITELAGVILSYLNDVHGALAERLTFLSELSGLDSILFLVKTRLDESNFSDPWFTSIRALVITDGPLDQFRSALAQLVIKLEKSGLIRLLWKWRKLEVKETLQRIEQIKSLVSFALNDDLWYTIYLQFYTMIHLTDLPSH